MSTLVEPPVFIPEAAEAPAPVEAPPDFGRCPVCDKPLFPRCRMTGQPKAPPPGTGYESRAKCDGCGTILVYLGGKRWRVMEPTDFDDADQEAMKMDSFLGAYD